MAAPHSSPSAARFSKETRNVLLSVGLSALTAAAVAFPVAVYTSDGADARQARDAERARLAAVYLPLATATSNVVACIPEAGCSEDELLRTGRAFNKAYLLAGAQGSNETIEDAAERMLASLKRLVGERIRGTRPSEALVQRAAVDFTELQRLISRALSE